MDISEEDNRYGHMVMMNHMVTEMQDSFKETERLEWILKCLDNNVEWDIMSFLLNRDEPFSDEERTEMEVSIEDWKSSVKSVASEIFNTASSIFAMKYKRIERLPYAANEKLAVINNRVINCVSYPVLKEFISSIGGFKNLKVALYMATNSITPRDGETEFDLGNRLVDILDNSLKSLSNKFVTYDLTGKRFRLDRNAFVRQKKSVAAHGYNFMNKEILTNLVNDINNFMDMEKSTLETMKIKLLAKVDEYPRVVDRLSRIITRIYNSVYKICRLVYYEVFHVHTSLTRLITMVS